MRPSLFPRTRRVAHCLTVALGLCGLGACSAPGTRSDTPTAPAVLRTLTREDVLWLERTGFTIDAESLAEYARLGRSGYLAQQLHPQGSALPDALRAALGTAPDALTTLSAVQAKRRAINDLPEAQRQPAREALTLEGNQIAYDSMRRELLRALYSPARLQEIMTWFWLNHFSVYEYKADLRWLVGDYADNAIRPHALGHFRDLLLATLEHPAMLQFLDNDHNAVGRINENYARELMELHTLGVQAGYSQQDVQQLAHILTGVGVNMGAAPHLAPALRPLYRREGAFEFNPARHDAAPAMLLGHAIAGRGFSEVENAVALIVHQPACATYLSRQIATYFMADDPPASVVAAMARTFERSDGDIAAVLRTLLLSHEFAASLGGKFKDPDRYVFSAVRLSYPQQYISNVRPVLNWLRTLGEGPFDRQTPDGYPLTAAGWNSPGQLSRRFEIARAIGAGNAHLLDEETPLIPPAATAPPAAPAHAVSAASVARPPAPLNAGGFAQPANRIYFAAFEPFLSAATRAALDSASSPQEWNTFLLASPDFNYE